MAKKKPKESKRDADERPSMTEGLKDYESLVREMWRPWVEKDYAPLKNAVKDAIPKHLMALTSNHPAQHFYGYSLYTANGITGLSPVANTAEHIHAERGEYYERCYYPDEWGYWEDYGTFETVNDIIFELHKEFESATRAWESLDRGRWTSPLDKEVEGYYWRNVERIFGAALQALVELQKEGGFDCIGRPPTYAVIWFSDADGREERMSRESVRQLNPAVSVEKFFEMWPDYSGVVDEELPLCEGCGEPVAKNEDVYRELFPHHGHAECAGLTYEVLGQQAAESEKARRQWARKERACPKCDTKFTSAQDLGVCPACGHAFYASHPELGRTHWWHAIGLSFSRETPNH